MTPCCCAKPSEPCCQPQVEKSEKSKPSWDLTKKLEIIAAVALCAIAAYVNFMMFSVSMLLGVTYQVLKMALNINQKGLGVQRPGCGQGFGELISQLRLLPTEIVLATSYVAWRHLVHDPAGFVPFVGFFVGMGIAHHAVTYFRKTPEKCCTNPPKRHTT